MKHFSLILALLVAPVAAVAQDENVVAGLSQNTVAITANFSGSEILIFGAVERQAPAPEDSILGVIITVEGPDRGLTVRRMDRRYGIWMNTEAVEIDSAPTFYAVATNAPLEDILSDVEDDALDITINRAIHAYYIDSDRPQDFIDAVIRIRENEDLYQTLEGAVQVRSDTLFDTSIRLPSNLVEGDYTARIFLTRDRQIVADFETEIEVAKVGLERIIYNLAHERPLIYGLLSLFIAIAAGWGASAVFRYIRS